MNHARPRQGGTLRLYGPGELDHLDPVCAPRPPVEQITRLLTRQLFGYRSTTDLRNWQAVAPVPDLAAEIPSIYNAGMGASYTSYVVHLRPGVCWDTTPARPVTTRDVVRGFKRMGNPLARSPMLPYFTDTIRGMAEFCDSYAAAISGAASTAAEFAAYQNSHDIPGLLVLDEQTLVFEVVRPALDFINILALPCASPAPIEYDAHLPNSPEWHRAIRSTGPYRLGQLEPGRQLRLDRNPVWRQDSDPIRRQHLDAVEVNAEPTTAVQVADRIGVGQADLAWGTRIADPDVVVPTRPEHGLGFALDPYLVFNTRGPNANRVLGRPEVRQAIGYAIDKAAIAALVAGLGTGTVIRIAHSAIPPGNDAHQEHAPYPTPDGHGDPAKCAALLAAAGCPAGLALTAIHPSTELGQSITRCYAADLLKAGVTVRPVELDESAYRDLLRDPTRAAAGEWDVAVEAQPPAWLHHNARVFVQSLFASQQTPGTANYGGYRNPEVDALIEQALVADEQSEAAQAVWRKAEQVAMADAPIVPILWQIPAAPELRGARVRGTAMLPALGYSLDLAALWLDPSPLA